MTALCGLALFAVLMIVRKPVLGTVPGDADAIGEIFMWGLFALILFWVMRVEQRPLASIEFKRPDWRTIVFGVIGAVLALAAFVITLRLVLPVLGLHMNMAESGKIAAHSTPFKLILVLRAALLEETLFRGYGIERLTELTGSKWLAGAVTLVAFALAHVTAWGWPQVIMAGAAGLVLTLLYVIRRDLGCNILAHFLTDAVGIFLA